MSSLERILRPVHRWVWRDERRAVRKLFTFAATEADGGRHLSRAAELTPDPLLRRLFLRHAQDEHHHAQLFRARGRTLLTTLRDRRPARFEAAWLAPGERGGDDLRVEDGRDASLLAFLHLSERIAAGRFAVYHDVISDAATREVFRQILRDEVFHVRYTRSQLERVVPEHHRRHLWAARASRLWRGYLRAATAVADLLGTILLVAQYFLIVPLFAVLAKRAARRERLGWSEPARREGRSGLERQY